MIKTALLLSLAATVMFSCKNGEKKEVTLKDNIETVDTAITDVHNSQNSLDWAGVYEGIVPCADCEGIKTVLELKDDNTYALSEAYLGKPGEKNEIKKTGNFIWDDSGSEVSLEDGENHPMFKVGENQLLMLDIEGDMIDGSMSDLYILKKKVE